MLMHEQTRHHAAAQLLVDAVRPDSRRRRALRPRGQTEDIATMLDYITCYCRGVVACCAAMMVLARSALGKPADHSNPCRCGTTVCSGYGAGRSPVFTNQ